MNVLEFTRGAGRTVGELSVKNCVETSEAQVASQILTPDGGNVEVPEARWGSNRQEISNQIGD